MKKSISLTLLLVLGLVLLSIASCGGSSDRKTVSTSNVRSTSNEQNQYAKVDNYDDYEDYDTYSAPVVSTFKTFAVYIDGRSPENHYIASGYMGDYSDINMDLSCFDNPHSGTTCIKIVYTNKASQGARWAGVYWQNPANNWGDRKGGYDLTGAKKLTFWARGENGNERIEEFKIGGITGVYPDSDVAGIGPVMLTREWKQYEIDLTGKDLSYISGGFCWATNLDVNPKGATFYLDDIKYE